MEVAGVKRARRLRRARRRMRPVWRRWGDTMVIATIGATAAIMLLGYTLLR